MKVSWWGDVTPAAFLATSASVSRLRRSFQVLPKFQVLHRSLPFGKHRIQRSLLVLRSNQMHTQSCVSCSEAASTSGRPGATPASGFAGSSNGASAGGAAGSSGAGGPPGTHIGGTSRLFENIKPIASEQVTATHEAPSQPGAAMRALSSAGNAALLGFLGAGAFFGYYTVRYNAEELQTVVHETRKPENQFLGSAVRTSAAGVQCSSICVALGAHRVSMSCRFGFPSWSGIWRIACTLSQK